MAGYQRFVAYVYEYRRGKKDGSSGYVRVEARDRKCRIEVHLRCAGLEPGSRCRVYGFLRREGLMDGILIGSCMTGRERIECMLETDTEDMGGAGKNLQELGGLLLISDAGGFWGTEWDDQPIRPENFREWKKEERTDVGENKEPAESKEAGSPVESQPEQSREKTENLETVSESKTMTVEEFREPLRPPEAPRPSKSPRRPPEASRPPELSGSPELPESPEAPRMSEAPRPPEPPRSPKPPRPPRPHPGTACDPFPDGQFTDCRRIRPSDCNMLCRKNGCFCSNRFVMYGYQNFGHLLLCRNHQGQYILGVPGSYSQQERFMANMFGFPYFKESPDIRIPGGKGGYWYCFIDV